MGGKKRNFLWLLADLFLGKIAAGDWPLIPIPCVIGVIPVIAVEPHPGQIPWIDASMDLLQNSISEMDSG